MTTVTPSPPESRARWAVQHVGPVLAGAGALVSVVVGLSYEYFYGYLDVRPSELGLGSQEIVLHAALGLALLLVSLSPLAMLFACVLGSRLQVAPAAESPAPAPTVDSAEPSARSGIAVLLAATFLVTTVAATVAIIRLAPGAATVCAFLAFGSLAAGGTVLALRRAEGGIPGRTWRSAWDVSIVGYASFVTFLGGAGIGGAAALADPPSELLFALGVALCTAAILGAGLARRWFRQRDGDDRPHRLFQTRADLVAGVVVAVWIVVLVVVSTGFDARYLLKEGAAPTGLGAPLRSAQITCMSVRWLDGQPPAGLPTNALYLGQSGGTTVLFEPGHGPVRVPSGRVALVPAEANACHR